MYERNVDRRLLTTVNKTDNLLTILCFCLRKWSLQTGKCQRIYRGHRDSVMCIQICDEMMVSGGKDNMCKGRQSVTNDSY